MNVRNVLSIKMSNKWNIPLDLENKIRLRDIVCFYCKKEFKNNHKDMATWEHIDNNAKHITEDNIVLCSGSCNSSKGIKSIKEWVKSPYCKERDISF